MTWAVLGTGRPWPAADQGITIVMPCVADHYLATAHHGITKSAHYYSNDMGLRLGTSTNLSVPKLIVQRIWAK